jgi:glycosyltransferase involved in cell wall biosynthesis
MIRILQFGMSPNYGGIEAFIMTYYRAIDKTKIQFDFFKNYKEKMAYEDEIVAMGGRIYYMEPVGLRNGWRNVRKKWTSFYAHTPVDSIHYNTIQLGDIFPIIYAKKTGLHVHVHAHPSTFSNGCSIGIRIRLEINKHMIHLYTKSLLACSSEAGKWMFGKGYEVVPNAIAIDKFSYNAKDRKEIRNKYGLNDSFVICNVGKVSKVKNQIFLLDIIKKIKNLGINVKFMIVGGGNKALVENIKIKAAELGVIENIVITGMVANPEYFYSASDVFVFPSLSEGFGIALLEAQANGLRCIVSDSIVKESNITGTVTYLPLHGDNENWVKVILKARDEGRLSSDLVKKVSEKYDIKKTVKRLEEIYGCDRRL